MLLLRFIYTTEFIDVIIYIHDYKDDLNTTN